MNVEAVVTNAQAVVTNAQAVVTNAQECRGDRTLDVENEQWKRSPPTPA